MRRRLDDRAVTESFRYCLVVTRSTWSKAFLVGGVGMCRCVWCAVLVVAATALVAEAREDARAPLRVRVMCYNIHHGKGVDGLVDLQRVARVIRAAEPDVVALQEVDYRIDRTGRVDQAVELARLTGMTAVPGDVIDVGHGRYGNAILSRWKVVEHATHLLPVATGREQRGVIVAAIDPGGDRPVFSLLCTHLDHRPDDRDRIAAARAINALVTTTDRPTLLAGDLNADPGGAVLEAFAETWVNPLAGRPLPTFPAAAPRRQIDFVLYRTATAWAFGTARVIDEAVASDHRPLLVELELVR